MTAKTPEPVNITLSHEKLSDIIRNHISKLDVENGGHAPNSINVDFKDDDWDDIKPQCYITIYF